MAADRYDDILNDIYQPTREGGKTGMRTKLDSSAVGRGQMTKGTLVRTLKKLGVSDKEMLTYINRYKTDPKTEHEVNRAHIQELSERTKKAFPNLSEAEQARKVKIGWYTGNPSAPEDKVPHPEAGNRQTAGEYADGRKAGTMKKSMTPVVAQADPKTTITMPSTDPKVRISSPPYVPLKLSQPLNTDTTLLVKPATTKTNTFNKDDYSGLIREQSKTTKIANAVVPYMSNMYALTQKPAQVPRPVMNSPVQLSRVNMNADRSQIDQDYSLTNKGIDQVSDFNTGFAAKMYNKSQRFNQMSKVNQDERNQNTQISNSEALTNAGIAQGNNAKLDTFRNSQAERQNAITKDRMANMSNASDKYIAQANTNSQYDLEANKAELLYGTDDKGTLKRMRDKVIKFKNGGRLYTAGRMIRTLKPVV
jgi:hypothetical protein